MLPYCRVLTRLLGFIIEPLGCTSAHSEQTEHENTRIHSHENTQAHMNPRSLTCIHAHSHENTYNSLYMRTRKAHMGTHRYTQAHMHPLAPLSMRTAETEQSPPFSMHVSGLTLPSH